jgi:hypothetical protein
MIHAQELGNSIHGIGAVRQDQDLADGGVQPPKTVEVTVLRPFLVRHLDVPVAADCGGRLSKGIQDRVEGTAQDGRNGLQQRCSPSAEAANSHPWWRPIAKGDSETARTVSMWERETRDRHVAPRTIQPTGRTRSGDTVGMCPPRPTLLDDVPRRSDEGVSPAVAADRLAEERMRSVGRLGTIRLPR